MPNATGETLNDRLAREPRLPPREAVRIGAALARSLVQLHRQGMKDCPITPANVLLHGNEARLLEEQPLLTRDNQPYLSPEEASGKKADELTDIYRLGALMFHMLTGSPPPRPAPSVHTLRRDVTRQLDAAIARALANEPASRFSRAAQFAEILEDSQTAHTDHSPHSYRPSQVAIVDSFEFVEEETRSEQKRRQKIRRRIVVLLVLLGGAVAGLFLVKR
jgi:serine/threonine protein kinase